MQPPTAKLVGVPSSTDQSLGRVTICHVHNAKDAGEHLTNIMVEMWATKTASEAYRTLAKPDVVVTSLKDKEIQLEKLKGLDKDIIRVRNQRKGGAG